MDGRRPVWDRSNRKHLTQDHLERAVSISDIEEVLADASRDERYDPVRDNYLVLGRTKAGQWLIVVWVDHPRGRYPIHVRPANSKIRRKWQKQ
jgi:uncharacterized DUF497 family protein